MLLNLLKKSFAVSWNGKLGILFPVILRVMAGVLRLGMLLLACALMAAASEYPLDNGVIVRWFVLFGLPILLWWFFSASCRLMWWHELEKGSDESRNSRVWLADLPPMLCLDFFFALMKILCFAAVVLGVWAMSMGRILAVLTVPIAALTALLCTIIQPVVIAERVVSGASLIQSVINAVSDIRRCPASTLAVQFLPEIAALTFYMSAFVMGILGNTLLLWMLSLVGWLISMIKPVFWNELVRMANRGIVLSDTAA